MLFVSSNLGKLREIKEILSDCDIEIYDNKEIKIVEDQESFYGNAYKKAKTIFEITGIPTIADDSGLCINGLNGFPGVNTHRFLGDNASDEEINRYLIERCSSLDDKTAQVICSLIYYDGENVLDGEGIITGIITDEIRGLNGFGFDSIFELASGKTLAELTLEEKNEISARKLAAVELKQKLLLLGKVR